MTTRLFAVISGLCIVCMMGVSLALVPEILRADPDTIHRYRGIGLVVMAFGGPIVVVTVLSTWIWEISARALKRRGIRRG